MSSREGNEDTAVTTALPEEGKPNRKEKVKEPRLPCSLGRRWRILPAEAGVLCSPVRVQEYKEMALSRDSAPGDKLGGDCRRVCGHFPPLRLADYISHPRARLPDLTWSTSERWDGGRRAAPRGQENSQGRCSPMRRCLGSKEVLNSAGEGRGSKMRPPQGKKPSSMGPRNSRRLEICITKRTLGSRRKGM